MVGFITAIIAGMAMSIQGVWNTRLSEKIGLYESNMIVQGTAFILALIFMFILKSGNLKEIVNCNKLYLLGGVLGIVITITVMLSIKNLSPTIAISIILIAQLVVAALIDAFGLFGTKKVPIGWEQILGLVLMITGVIFFKK